MITCMDMNMVPFDRDCEPEGYVALENNRPISRAANLERAHSNRTSRRLQVRRYVQYATLLVLVRGGQCRTYANGDALA